MKKLSLTFLLFFSLIATGWAGISAASDVLKVSGQEIYKDSIGGDSDNVIIGDEKAPTNFKNKITFKKWKNNNGDYENTLSIIPPTNLIPSANTSLVSKQLVTKNNKVGFYFNKDPNSDDNFKFGLILYQLEDKYLSPDGKSYQWEFDIEHYQDYDFIYQYNEEDDVELHPENLISENTDYWEIKHSNGHIVNIYKKYWKSYAVYHKTKKDYIVGVTPNYMNGKIGGFLRIRILDADGKFLNYGDLYIKDGKYRVTAPKEINSGKLPLKFNDTFGYTTAPTYGTDSGDNEAITCGDAYTNPVGSGTLTSITFYIDGNGTSTYKAKVALFIRVTDTATLVANSSTGEFSVPATKGTGTTTNTGAASVGAGVTYLFGFNNNNSAVRYWFDSATIYSGWVGGNAYADFPPASFTSDNSGTAYRWGIYATYTPSGGAIALSGTVTTATEADLRAGGKTVILTITGDTWVASGATFDAQRQNIINGLTSAQSETKGWNNEVKGKIAVTDVVRTSDTVVTITLDAEAAYNITATETITATVPATALTLNTQIVASPTFNITAVVGTSIPLFMHHYQMMKGR